MLRHVAALNGKMSLWIAFIVALSLCSAANAVYVETGQCAEIERNHYTYEMTEEYFEDEMVQTSVMVVHFHVTCKSIGTYKSSHAVRFVVDITGIEFRGNVIEKHNEMDVHMPGFEDRVSANEFEYAQHKDGSIPAAFFSREEDEEVANLKKAIVSAFQANFEGTKSRTEADTNSVHTSNYHYLSSIQDMDNGIISMTRTVDSDDVISYAQHLPNDEVEMHREESVTYQNGVLTEGSGNVECRLMPKEPEDDDTEEDSLEGARNRDRRNEPTDPNTIKSYDSTVETHKYESSGSYKLKKVGTSRVLRSKRSSMKNDADLVEMTLLGVINQTRRSMDKIAELRNEFGDMDEALDQLERQLNNTKLAQKIEAVLKLESKYGPPQPFSPAIDVVLERFNKLLGSPDKNDRQMRKLLYFMLSAEGSLRSQMALLNGLEKAVEDEELESAYLYIALVANPKPQFVARLERIISPDVHSNDPLLLAYGAIIPRASHGLQDRMALFIMDRLPGAENNHSSLVHHILSIGNSGSNKTIETLIGYLSNPDTDIQLVSIFAMRFLLNRSSIQQTLRDIITHPDVTEDQVTMVAKALMLGTERAKLNHEQKPYSQDLAESLVVLAVATQNEELHTALISYLKLINTPESRSLLRLLRQATKLPTMDKEYTNATRFRRGKQWDESNPVYDLVAPLSERRSDVQTYQHRLAYIWGKQFGGKDINAQVAAGGIAGVANSGSYKLFGHAVAKANCYDHSLTIIEFLILRKKDSSQTLSRVYSVVMGVTVVNINLEQDSSVCATKEKDLYEGQVYTVFDFTYSIFVVVGTLNFGLKATIQFSAGLYIEFCENQGSVTVRAGLSPTMTIVVAASGDLEILWVAKAGLTLEATFNYQVLPEVNTEFCYKNGAIRVKNCLGIYHQWTDNTLELYAWYAWRGWCGWWACTGSQAYKNKNKISGLSITWDLPGTDKLKIWELCDAQHTC